MRVRPKFGLFDASGKCLISSANLHIAKCFVREETSVVAVVRKFVPVFGRFALSLSVAAAGNELERALRKIGREDVIRKCMYNIEDVTDEMERAVAKVHIDQAGAYPLLPPVLPPV